MLEHTGLSSVLTFKTGDSLAKMKQVADAYAVLTGKAKKGSATVIVSAASLQRASQTSQLLGGNLGAVAGVFNTIASAARSVGSVISRGGIAVSNLGRAMGFATMAAAPIGLALKSGAQDATDFEQAMANLKAVSEPTDNLKLAE